MSESDMRREFCLLTATLDPKPMENLIGKGTPDVNLTTGWVELKWLRQWPKRAGTPVRLEHFTIEQKMWLQQRWDRGGGAWLVLQCKREWLVFRGCDVNPIGELNRAELQLLRWARWDRKPLANELCEALHR